MTQNSTSWTKRFECRVRWNVTSNKQSVRRTKEEIQSPCHRCLLKAYSGYDEYLFMPLLIVSKTEVVQTTCTVASYFRRCHKADLRPVHTKTNKINANMHERPLFAGDTH